MSIKLTLLKTGEQIISDMKELVAEGKDEPHAYLLENPHTVNIIEKQFVTEEEIKTGADYGINVSLLPWIILSEDIEVRNVEFKDGLLTVKLGKVVPEHHAKKVYL